VSYIVEQDLLDTVLESLVITLVAVFLFLTAAYWLTGASASLGAITLLPVAFSVSWILGTMYLIGMPFNVLTGMITSLTVGLGVAYSIHISERYRLELERQGNVWSALQTTVTGTGGRCSAVPRPPSAASGRSPSRSSPRSGSSGSSPG